MKTFAFTWFLTCLVIFGLIILFDPFVGTPLLLLVIFFQNFGVIFALVVLSMLSIIDKHITKYFERLDAKEAKLYYIAIDKKWDNFDAPFYRGVIAQVKDNTVTCITLVHGNNDVLVKQAELASCGVFETGEPFSHEAALFTGWREM